MPYKGCGEWEKDVVRLRTRILDRFEEFNSLSAADWAILRRSTFNRISANTTNIVIPFLQWLFILQRSIAFCNKSACTCSTLLATSKLHAACLFPSCFALLNVYGVHFIELKCLSRNRSIQVVACSFNFNL